MKHIKAIYRWFGHPTLGAIPNSFQAAQQANHKLAPHNNAVGFKLRMKVRFYDGVFILIVLNLP
ncbi:MAG: hypothetical protein GY820_32170 [Gammaproteobacteria bacterium]|nr:hypothetical protein [Gammaproteobacteria bacterium]